MDNAYFCTRIAAGLRSPFPDGMDPGNGCLLDDASQRYQRDVLCSDALPVWTDDATGTATRSHSNASHVPSIPLGHCIPHRVVLRSLGSSRGGVGHSDAGCMVVLYVDIIDMGMASRDTKIFGGR